MQTKDREADLQHECYESEILAVTWKRHKFQQKLVNLPVILTAALAKRYMLSRPVPSDTLEKRKCYGRRT